MCLSNSRNRQAYNPTTGEKIMMIIASAFIAFLSMCFTVWKLGDQWVRRMFGYDYLIDVAMGLFLTVIFGMTATITGVLVAVVTNFMIGVGLWIGKNTYGYEKLCFSYWKWRCIPMFKWVQYEGQWVIDLRSGSKNIIKRILKFFIGSSYERPTPAGCIGSY